MKIRVLSACLMFFFIYITKAQTISGSISNYDNNEIINSANIIIKELSNPKNIVEFKIVHNGKFSIKLKKQYSTILIEIKSYGYKDYKSIIQNLVLHKEYNLNVRLNKDHIFKLDEVVIIGEKKI